MKEKSVRDLGVLRVMLSAQASSGASRSSAIFNIIALLGPAGGFMNFNFRSSICVLVVSMLVVTLVLPQDMLAQEHVVSAADLRRDTVAAAQVRQSNQVKVVKFFSSEQAKKALKSVNLPYQRVQKAVSQLSDEELARLAARTDKIQNDFAAGALTNQEITYILIALATAVIVIILVAAR